jgi:hypothetical protein
MEFAIRKFLIRNLQARIEICRCVAKSLEDELKDRSITEIERLAVDARRNENAEVCRSLQHELAELEQEEKIRRAGLN